MGPIAPGVLGGSTGSSSAGAFTTPRILDWLSGCSVGTTRTLRFQRKIYDPQGNCEVYDVECDQVCVRGDGILTGNHWAMAPGGCTATLNVRDTQLCV